MDDARTEARPMPWQSEAEQFVDIIRRCDRTTAVELLAAQFAVIESGGLHKGLIALELAMTGTRKDARI